MPTIGRFAMIAVAMGTMAATGCQIEKEQRDRQLAGPDPLKYERIQSPEVPTGRDRYGTKEKIDPFLRADSNLGEDRRSSGLAGRSRLAAPGDASADVLVKELEKLGAKVFQPSKVGSGSEVRVNVPHSIQGAMSGYIGTGKTDAEALRDAYEQIRADVNK